VFYLPAACLGGAHVFTVSSNFVAQAVIEQRLPVLRKILA